MLLMSPPAPTLTWKAKIWFCALALSATVVPVLLALKVRWNWTHVHQHCIKVAGMAFRTYAINHEGRYPSHTNGFGDALALLAVEQPEMAHNLVGVDDDGSRLLAAATNHTHLRDEVCTRIYVQGLGETNTSSLAILFDRYAVVGGDHHRGKGSYLREVLFVGDYVQEVALKDWPAFARSQVELLVQEGIVRPVAEAYYAPTLRPDAIR